MDLLGSLAVVVVLLPLGIRTFFLARFFEVFFVVLSFFFAPLCFSRPVAGRFSGDVSFFFGRRAPWWRIFAPPPFAEKVPIFVFFCITPPVPSPPPSPAAGRPGDFFRVLTQ